MLDHSGFGWNETSQMIVVSDEVFESYVKIDLFAKTLRFKSFPYYSAWTEIFGKDRDTGELAEDIYNASNNVSYSCVPSNTEHVSSKKSKKSRSTVDEKFDTFVTVIDYLGDIAKLFGVEANDSHARGQVLSAAEGVTDLTIEQKCVT
ncbi:UNVERIFIED_CONTAM: hypothetical protein Sradi_2968200 [Sesamum radiatum]|uniref:Myb/SANT-like domain-containing protein n=1 Tax=Sesamum radiatum TaxID=300843 RepID=A0AAW2S009_SESRA